MIRPCRCSGSQEYVHESCLKLYRLRHPLHNSFSRCPTCGYAYRFKSSPISDFIFHPVTATTMFVCLAAFACGYGFGPVASTIFYFRKTLKHGIVPFGPLVTSHHGWLDHFVRGSCVLALLGALMLTWDVAVMCWKGNTDLQLWFVGTFFFLLPMLPAGTIVAGVLPVVLWAYTVIGGWCRRYRADTEMGRLLEYDGEERARTDM